MNAISVPSCKPKRFGGKNLHAFSRLKQNRKAKLQNHPRKSRHQLICAILIQPMLQQSIGEKNEYETYLRWSKLLYCVYSWGKNCPGERKTTIQSLFQRFWNNTNFNNTMIINKIHLLINKRDFTLIFHHLHFHFLDYCT